MKPRPGRWPDFIVIGAMKSGTTSLFRMLSRHPDIFMCEPKEPMFFSRDHVFERGYEWYRSLFAEATDTQICGEASTCYSRWPHYGDVAGRIQQVLPDIKMIYIMRHPVERAYSHYAWDQRHRVSSTFAESLEQKASIVDASMYIRQIEQYLRYFSRDQLLPLILDDLEEDPDSVAEQVQGFLGVGQTLLTRQESVVANRAGEIQARSVLVEQLRRVRRWPAVRQVADVAGGPARAWVLGRLVQWQMNSRRGRRIADEHRARLEPMSPATRDALLERFEAPTRELEDFLGRKLPAWFL